MGLFKKLKKAFKKVTGAVKKVVKKVVKGVKKVVKKVTSSKILKALAIAAAVIVTGGAAMSAMGATTGAGLFGSAAAAGGTGFAGWMTGTAASLTSTALGSALATPFTMLGTGLGKAALALGVPAISNAAAAPLTSAQINTILTTNPATAAKASTAASRGALNLPSTIPGASAASSATGTAAQQLAATASTLPSATAGSFATSGGVVGAVGGTAAQQLATTVPAALGKSSIGTAAAASAAPTASWFARHPKLTAGLGTVATGVATGVLTGAVGQYIAGDPEQQGSMAGAAVEGGEYLDPLKVYAAQQGINTDVIYQHMMYGNVDPSSQYGTDLYRQQTFGVA